MLPSTSPRAILYLPSPGQPSARKSHANRTGDSTPDGWVRVDEAYRGAKIFLDPDLRQQLRQPNGHHHLSVPVCEDAGRLGMQGLKTVHKVQLEVFSALAHSVLPRASGAQMRLYFEQIGRGEPASLTDCTALTTEELIHFREYFGRLPEYWRGQSLGRPEILAVALHLLGGSARPGPSLQTSTSAKDELLSAAAHWLVQDGPVLTRRWHELAALGGRQLDRLKAGRSALKKAITKTHGAALATVRQRGELNHLNARCNELECYISLIKTILLVVHEPSVQVMLAPPPPLTGHAKTVGHWLGGMAASGVKALGDKMMQALQPEQGTPNP